MDSVIVQALGAPAIQKKKRDKNKPIKVLWYSDFLCPTGFGNVAQSIVSRLQATGKYQFEIIGINHHGKPYNHPESPYFQFRDIPVHTALEANKGDFLGRDKLLNLLANGDYDIFFALQDTFNMASIAEDLRNIKKVKNFQYIFYFPIDGLIKEEWVKDGIMVADKPVAYTEYGRSMISAYQPELANIPIIYHGADTELFKPLSEQERREIRGKIFGVFSDDEIVISNINRNQPRKDLPRTIMAFQEYHKKFPKALLYLHCHTRDSAGHDLISFTKRFISKEAASRITFPNKEIMEKGGYPIEMLAKIYAASDMVVSTSLGEGWGLSFSEALSCETPLIAPRNTSAVEIIGADEERGYLVKCGEDLNHWFLQKHDNETIRPLTDIHDLVDKMIYVTTHLPEARQKAKNGRKWLVDNYTWDKVAKEWDKLFSEEL